MSASQTCKTHTYATSGNQVYPKWSKIAISVNARNRVVIRDTDDGGNEQALPGEHSVHVVPLQERVPEEDRISNSP